jgi:hypothetical protein
VHANESSSLYVRTVLQSVPTDLSLPVEDHGATWPSQALVGSGGHNVAVCEGAGDAACSHKSTDVSHVSEQVGAVLVSDLAHPGVVDAAGVRTGSCYNQLLRRCCTKFIEQ